MSATNQNSDNIDKLQESGKNQEAATGDDQAAQLQMVMALT